VNTISVGSRDRIEGRELQRVNVVRGDCKPREKKEIHAGWRCH